MQQEKRSAARKAYGLALGIGAGLILLASCGGGGGSSSAPTPAINNAPVFTSGSTVSVVENGTGTIYQATAADADGDAVTFTISGGADAARFAITSTGQLSFTVPPDYDLPADANGDNLYEVQLGASDGKATSALTISVAVTNSKEGIAVHRVGTGFINPVAVAPIDDWTLLVAEKDGAIYKLDTRGGNPVLLIRIANVGGSGVLGMAIHNNFALVGRFYVMYASTTGFLVVYPFDTIWGDPPAQQADSPLLAEPADHYSGGGWLGVDSSGDILIATSDAGGSGDPSGSAQDSGSRLGKILRITDPNSDGSSYITSTIAKGLHHPSGGSIYAGALLIADSGQDVAEEVDYLVPNSAITNFGWPFKEGTHVVRSNPPAGLTDPVIEYLRSSGTGAGLSIVGGAVGSSAIPSLRGQYIFADRGGAIFSVPAASIQQGRTLAAGSLERRDADFAPDQGKIDQPVAVTADDTGTIYIVDDDGDIFRVDAG